MELTMSRSTDDPAAAPHSIYARNTAFRLVASVSPADRVKAALRYDTRDPYAVSVYFGPGIGRFLFSRDLLGAGLHLECGRGAVRVGPSVEPGRTILEVPTVYGSVEFEGDTMALSQFLVGTYEIVPLGEEQGWLDLDAVIAKLLR
jgi:hypothetical protein